MDNTEQQTDLNQNGRKYGEEMQSVLFDKFISVTHRLVMLYKDDDGKAVIPGKLVDDAQELIWELEKSLHKDAEDDSLGWHYNEFGELVSRRVIIKDRFCRYRIEKNTVKLGNHETEYCEALLIVLGGQYKIRLDYCRDEEVAKKLCEEDFKRYAEAFHLDFADKPKLKPCPFCGGEAEYYEICADMDYMEFGSEAGIKCKNCGCCVQTGNVNDTHDTIVEKWNMRL